MKWFWICARAVFACAMVMLALLAAAVKPDLKQVSNVYILSMGNGMDQFLANQLTNAGVFQVVTDPKKADAILTDRLGEGFEKKLDELYPPPPTAEQIQKQEEDKEKDKDAKRRGFDVGGPVGHPASSSSFSSARGTFFLVDRKTRAVIWSVYEPPAKDSSPAAMTKVAAKVLKRLEADMSGKKPE